MKPDGIITDDRHQPRTRRHRAVGVGMNCVILYRWNGGPVLVVWDNGIIREFADRDAAIAYLEDWPIAGEQFDAQIVELDEL